MANPATKRRQRLEVTGIVQGVGFRPHVYALAQRLGLTGFVRNHSSGVTIEVEGPADLVGRFAQSLQTGLPPLARIDAIEVSQLSAVGSVGFHIQESETIPAASTTISPDVATCDRCLAEMCDPANRRYRYPFINCTNCGPRYTIVRGTPYDRPRTTMGAFTMCAACSKEYHDPTNRRYHAQPNACPDCGPTIWYVRAADPETEFTAPARQIVEAALAAFHESIDRGDVVAVKGIGGFHLACAAENSDAVQTLRERKGRVEKPLAVMVADVDTARRVAHIDDEEERLLVSRARPIVLLRRRVDSGLSDLVAPRNQFVGIMLPYSPLHALLVERRPLVMTSGNVSEEPIVRTNCEACERLRPLADAFLLHNREIYVVCDDSVLRVVQGGELPVRRSRGYAPLPIHLRESGPCVLAVGGELKTTFCLTRGDAAYMSPHIGDMGNLETLAAFRRAVDHFKTLFRAEPQVVVCDMHPQYLSSQWARDHGRRHGLPVVEVQHHHAHLAAVLTEHGFPPVQPVLGVSFDGTGYGPDGAIWGGEFLVASCRAYRRWAHLKYVPLPGGDAAIKNPYRAALAHLWAAGLDWDERLACVRHASRKERTVLHRQLERNLNCTTTSSMGRLFDAVAAIIGVCQSASYEAQAAMELESLVTDVHNAEPYPFSVVDADPLQVDTGPLLTAVCSDAVHNVPQATIVNRFHATLVEIIARLCQRAREETGISTVALSGGVFQNRVLVDHAVRRLAALDFRVLTHRTVPPNDGGLALGQAAVALFTTPRVQD